jgi:nitrate reductase NapE component
VLPWTVVAHFAARLQQAWHGPRTPRQAPGRGRLRALAGGPARIARLAWQSLGLFLAVALFPLLAVGVLAVVILGAVPIPWVRQLAVALQRLLSTSVGDSFVLVSSPTRGQATVTRVERDLRWLSDRCQRVAVVAHSQGVAIAHRAVRRVPPGERRLAKFVTVGSGQTKLVDLESLRDSDAAREVWLAPAGLLVLASSIWLAVDTLRPGGRERPTTAGGSGRSGSP